MGSPLTYVIALYIRLSTEDSKVGSFSIENQRHTLRQYAEDMMMEGDSVLVVISGYRISDIREILED